MNDVEMSDPVNDTEEQDNGIVKDTTSRLEAIGEKLDRLQAKFDEKLIYDSLKDQQIKQLSDQVDTYRAGIGFPIIRSLALQIHAYRESLLRFTLSESVQQNPAIAAELDLFVAELDEILQNQGFAILSSEPGSTFNSALQRVSNPIPTRDEMLAGQIAQPKKSGLSYQRADGSSITVIPETVDVYKVTLPTEGDNE
jgi:molecular chaperone GrpE (heat shock protein)